MFIALSIVRNYDNQTAGSITLNTDQRPEFQKPKAHDAEPMLDELKFHLAGEAAEARFKFSDPKAVADYYDDESRTEMPAEKMAKYAVASLWTCVALRRMRRRVAKGQDWDYAIKLARKLCKVGRARFGSKPEQLLEKTMRVVLDEMASTLWPGIVAIAEALLSRERLTGDEATLLWRDPTHLLPPPAVRSFGPPPGMLF
jgi:hypothetical protein